VLQSYEKTRAEQNKFIYFFAECSNFGEVKVTKKRVKCKRIHIFLFISECSNFGEAKVTKKY